MAGENDYKIPFGVDGSTFFKELNDMSKGVATLDTNVKEANKDMQEAFTQTGKASEGLNQKLKQNAEQAQALKQVAKDMGKDIAASLATAGKSKDFENMVSKFQNELLKVQKNSKVKIDVVFNESTIKELANAIAKGTNELESFNAVLAQSKQQLASLDPNSEEFASLNQQIQLTEGLLQGLGEAEQIAETGGKSLRAQLRGMKADLAEMELAGKGNTQEFQQLSIRAGELEDQIGDVSQRVRVLASDSKYIDAAVQAATGLFGAFTAVQGVTALLGNDNEELNKALQKVTGAMAILQGVQAVATALNKDSALRVLLFSRAQDAATVSTVAQTTAVEGETAATLTATAATRSWTAALLSNPFTAIAVAIAAVVASIIYFVTASGDAKTATEELTEALERQNIKLANNEAEIRRRGALLVAQAKSEGKTAEEIANIEAKTLTDRLAAQVSYSKRIADLIEEGNASEKKDLAKLEELGKAFTDSQEKQKDLQNEIDIKGYDAKTEANKKNTELSKKAVEDAKKSAEATQKINEQVVNFTKALQNEQLEALKEGYDKERQQANIQAQQKIADLNKETALSKQAIKLRADAILQINANLVKQIADIDKEELKEKSLLQLRADELIISLRKESAQKELDLLAVQEQQQLNQIREDYKLRADLIPQLESAVLAATENKRKEINLQAALDAIDNQDKIQRAIIETMYGYGRQTVAAEQAKNQAFLRADINFYQQQLDALKKAGVEESDVRVNQIKAALNKAKSELEKFKNNKPVSIFTLLGLDDYLSDEDQKAITQSANKAFGEIQKLLRVQIDGEIADIDRRIAKKQESIDKDNEEIDALKSNLEKQKELQSKGLANTANNLQREIDIKEKAKEDEVKLQNQLIEEKKAAQKKQAAIDSLQQVSSIATAIADVIAGWSTVPFVGSLLGILAAGAMVAAFVTTKANAKSSIESQGYAEGGPIDGPSHAGGGIKYYSNDGNAVRELEGGEYVVRKSAYKKHAELTEAINNDDLRGMSNAALYDLLDGLGVHFDNDTLSQGIKESRINEANNNSITLTEMPSDELKSIDKNVSTLVDIEKKKTDSWEENGYLFVRRGNRVTKYKI